jgi:hypothetical protein
VVGKALPPVYTVCADVPGSIGDQILQKETPVSFVHPAAGHSASREMGLSEKWRLQMRMLDVG